MPFIPYKFILSLGAAIIVPCFGRLALHGSGVEHELYRYSVPMLVGAVAGFTVGHYLDKWKRSLQLLEETNKRLQDEGKRGDIADSWHFALFDKSHSVILVIDPASGKIIDANPRAATFYGRQIKDLKRMRIQDINLSNNKDIAFNLKQANKETRKIFYFKHRVAGGEVKDVEVVTGAITIDNKPLLLSFVQDITELNRLRGILSICSHCKKVREKNGDWKEVEQFIENNSAASCSHAICPSCIDRLYPNHAKDPRIEALT